MKKRVLCFAIILLLLISSTILAGENEKFTEKNNLEINQKINEILSNEIVLPNEIEKITKTIIGMSSEEKITLSLIIIFFTLVIFLFFIAHNLVELLPSFDSVSAYLGAFVIILLLSLLELLKMTSQFLLGLNKKIELISEIDILGLLMGIGTTIIVYLLISIIMGIIKQSVVKGRAISEGVSIGAQLAKLKSMAEIEELSRKH